MAMISKGLSTKGHRIHLLGNAIMKDSQYVKNFNATHSSWYLSNHEKYLQEIRFVLDDAVQNGIGFAGFKLYYGVTHTTSHECRDLFAHSDLLLQLKAENYDMIVMDIFLPCDALIARYLDKPFIAVTTTREYHFFRASAFGFPSELSYVPEIFVGLTDKMTFFERLENVLLRFFQRFIFQYFLLADARAIQKEQGIDIDTDILDIMGKASLWISYSDLSLEYPQPTMPNYVRSGGMALKQTLPLEQDLEDFVQGSGDHGVIVFTLGSMVGSLPDHRKTEIIANVFSRLPQRIIWRHTGELPTNLGSNIKIMKWIPQNDLLGHAKTRLYIGHGGLNGVYEALHNAVPMILMPVLAPDQKDTAARVVSKVMGLRLDSATITEESFYEAIKEVLQNDKYRKNVALNSAILRDMPPAKDRVVFWIEHVMKFGDEHLRAHVFELNLIQYYLVDVAVFLVLCIMGFILGHVKTRLYIGHGGLNGVYEALYNAFPMILMPVMAPDQKDTATRVVSKGMGLRLDSATITEESFYEAINEVLQTDT
ncbi:UDP-glucuronosyltransferase 2C1-like [Amphiura filiformis]|uniref:UDP-glucuronosyltransferase 2C1-like n=1 Tax=Amphiura filiformis TaxID=82378 RepID=UPI003B20EA75